MGSRQRPTATDSRTQTLLKASQSFLEDQNYEECRNHALRAQESDPNHPGPTQLIAVADVFTAFKTTISSAAAAGSSKKSDYYAILGLPKFTGDLNLIKSNFENLAGLLNPNQNSYPLADQAYKLICKAWRVLSNPVQKAEFDEELSMKLRSDNRTFWTVCTFCFHLYEYPSEYENKFLKCQNEKCGEAFNAVASSPPPPEVIAKGEYDCLEVMSIKIDEKFTNGDYAKALRNEPNGVKSGGMKKRKMAAKSSKKLMGKGVRVELDGSVLF